MLQYGNGFRNAFLKNIITKRILEFMMNETQLSTGTELVWQWVAIGRQENKQILALSMSKERNPIVVERFITGLVKIH